MRTCHAGRRSADMICHIQPERGESLERIQDYSTIVVPTTFGV